MVLILYADLMSNPCRVIHNFLRVHNVDFELREISIFKEETRSEEYKKVNPLGKVPYLVHDGFGVSESVAIMMYLASMFDVPNHWYPRDLRQRARVDEVLAWQHTSQYSLRHYGLELIHNKCTEVIRFNTNYSVKRFNKDLEGLKKTISFMETTYLTDTPFLNCNVASIADMLAAEEILQIIPVVLDDLLKDHPVMTAWIERVKAAVGPVMIESAEKYDQAARAFMAMNKDLIDSKTVE